MSEYIEVTLTWAQAASAAMIGLHRNMRAMKEGRVHRADSRAMNDYSVENAWTNHVEGAAGEMACAKALNIFYPATINTFGAPDIARLEVKTRLKHNYELRIFRDSPDEDAYVLVTGRIPTFRVWGWLWGHEAKREDWWKDPGKYDQPAYFAPHSALRPLSTLPPELLYPGGAIVERTER